MAFRILVTEPMSDIGPEWLRENGYEIRYGRGVDRETLIEDLQGCQGVITRLAQISAEVLEKAPSIKVIARHGAGIDSVDVDYCHAHGITVLRNVGTNSVAVAEHAVTLMLSCAKEMNRRQALLRAGEFNKARKLPGAVEMGGKTLGLIGLGNVGRIVAKICALGFGMKVIAYDPYATPQSVADYVKLTANRADVFKTADFVSVHMPATKETKDSIGEEDFRLMKKNAHFINTARGTLVREEELINILREGVIAGAGLDVTRAEPTEDDNPLFTLENVIMTPHCAGSSEEAKDKASMACAKGCHAVLTNQSVEAPAFVVK